MVFSISDGKSKEKRKRYLGYNLNAANFHFDNRRIILIHNFVAQNISNISIFSELSIPRKYHNIKSIFNSHCHPTAIFFILFRESILCLENWLKLNVWVVKFENSTLTNLVELKDKQRPLFDLNFRKAFLWKQKVESHKMIFAFINVRD